MHWASSRHETTARVKAKVERKVIGGTVHHEGYLAYDDEHGECDYPDEEDYVPGNEAYLGYDTSSYDGWEAWDPVTAWYHDDGTWDDWSQAYAGDETADSHVYEEMIDSCMPEELANPAMAAANLQMWVEERGDGNTRLDGNCLYFGYGGLM